LKRVFKDSKKLALKIKKIDKKERKVKENRFEEKLLI